MECLNRTLITRARAMLDNSGLTWPWWAEAVNIANYICNNTLSRTLERRSRGDNTMPGNSGPLTPEER